MHEKIVITGAGSITPLGLSVDETWQNTIAGHSGVGPITLFDATDFQVTVAADAWGRYTFK